MLPIVQAGSLQLLVVQAKTGRLYDPKLGIQSDARATNVPSVLRYLGLIKHNVESGCCHCRLLLRKSLGLSFVWHVPDSKSRVARSEVRRAWRIARNICHASHAHRYHSGTCHTSLPLWDVPHVAIALGRATRTFAERKATLTIVPQPLVDALACKGSPPPPSQQAY